MAAKPTAQAPDPRPCHDPGSVASASGRAPEAPASPVMPAYDVGDPLGAEEQAILERLARLVHELDPNIPPEEVRPERTLWEIGYDSLGLVALRLGVKRAFGPGVNALYWLQLHAERPRIGCFVRFLAANGARAS